MPAILRVSEHFCCAAEGACLSVYHTRYVKTGSEWGKRFESGKCVPMLIKACQASGLIELHGVSDLRQRTFIFLRFLDKDISVSITSIALREHQLRRWERLQMSRNVKPNTPHSLCLNTCLLWMHSHFIVRRGWLKKNTYKKHAVEVSKTSDFSFEKCDLYSGADWKEWDNFNVSACTFTDVPLCPPFFLLSSNYSHTIFFWCSSPFSHLLLWGDVTLTWR